MQYLLFDTIWYGHILQRDQLGQVGQVVHKLDLLAEL